VSAGWRRTALLAPLAATAILLGPAAPGAAADTIMDMFLHSSNGYTLEITGVTGRTVTLTLSKSVGRGTVYATYSVGGRVNPKGISANFGRLGRVSIGFHSSAPLPARGCGGKRSIHRTGRFEGTIRFRGEQGFSAVSATRVEGVLGRRCSPASRARPAPAAQTSGRSPRYFLTHFVAAAKSSRQTIVIDSSTLGMLLPDGQLRDPRTLLLAELEEERGRVSIERSAIVRSEPIPASPLGTTPVTASLAPQTPFSGLGAYREEAGLPATWTGDLNVDLPGAEDVPLVGPEFTAILCRGELDPELDRCRDRAAGLLNTVD
jgi:hypothetical protein